MKKVELGGYDFLHISELTHVFCMGYASLLHRVLKRAKELNKDTTDLTEKELQEVFGALWDKIKKSMSEEEQEERLKRAYEKAQEKRS
jgi:hypothetical protein